MKRNLLILIVVLLASVSLASAHEHNFAETKQLIDSGISCDELTDEQLEAIGDHYMEQMHPGEAHEVMDDLMGGEGSERLRQIHINMARRLYCDESVHIGYGMMGTMPMMRGGDTMAFGMMGTGTFGMGLFGLVYFAAAAFVFSAIFWLTHNWLVKHKK